MCLSCPVDDFGKVFGTLQFPSGKQSFYRNSSLRSCNFSFDNWNLTFSVMYAVKDQLVVELVSS